MAKNCIKKGFITSTTYWVLTGWPGEENWDWYSTGHAWEEGKDIHGFGGETWKIYVQLGEYYCSHFKETALEAVNWSDMFEHSCEYERRNEFLVYIKCEEFPDSYRIITFLRRPLFRGASYIGWLISKELQINLEDCGPVWSNNLAFSGGTKKNNGRPVSHYSETSTLDITIKELNFWLRDRDTVVWSWNC
jgi:hypothetical protein